MEIYVQLVRILHKSSHINKLHSNLIKGKLTFDFYDKANHFPFRLPLINI